MLTDIGDAFARGHDAAMIGRVRSMRRWLQAAPLFLPRAQRASSDA